MSITQVLEKELETKYRKKWDAVNVYSKYIGTTTQDGKLMAVFSVYQIDRMSRNIIKNETVLV